MLVLSFELVTSWSRSFHIMALKPAAPAPPRNLSEMHISRPPDLLDQGPMWVPAVHILTSPAGDLLLT